jgi:transposase InsO family protein
MELRPYRPHTAIRYRAGRIHSNADPLSNAPLLATNSILLIYDHITTSQIDPNFQDKLKDRYKDDKDFGNIHSQLQQEIPPPHLRRFSLHSDILYYQDPANNHQRMCIPNQYQTRIDILHDHHDTITAGHLGCHKTYNSIARTYFWPKLGQDVKDYVRSCTSCQQNKNPSSGPKGQLSPLDIPPQRWHTVTMDFAGPFQMSGQYNQITVVVNKLFKRVHFIASESTDKATDTAHCFWDNIVKLHGIPAVIVSDRDAKFTSLFWTTLFARFGTKRAMSSAYHPQTDEQSEVMVKTVKDMLRHFVNQKQDNWSHQLPALEFAYNSSIPPSTEYNPFELDLGYHPKQPHQVTPVNTLKVRGVEEFIEHQMATLSIAQTHSQIAQHTQAQNYNKGRQAPVPFKEGDKVMLSTNNSTNGPQA